MFEKESFLHICVLPHFVCQSGSGCSKSSIHDGESQNRSQEDSAWFAERGCKNFRKNFIRKVIQVL